MHTQVRLNKLQVRVSRKKLFSEKLEIQDRADEKYKEHADKTVDDPLLFHPNQQGVN